MRKYQQLLLLLISLCSVIILLLYKNENSRLKDVLHVVNIFARSDEAVLRRLENTKDDNFLQFGPIPVWQALSESFHAYTAFWNRNELIAGGEVLSLVVGKYGAVVNFGCSLLYDGGLRNVRGKFHFQRVDNNNEDRDSEFTIYNFFCRIVRDFGHPEFVIFNDIGNSKHIAPELRIRHIKPLQKTNQPSNTLNICLDLVTPNRTMNFTKNESNMLQFFVHHQGLGVIDFIIYNSDELPQNVHNSLHQLHLHMRLHMMPFNFPFAIVNATERIRRIMETDCLVRNTNNVAYALLMQPNEFFYSNTKLDSPQSVLRTIRQYAGEINRFELPTFAVCMDRKQKLLVDSNLYDPEMKFKHKLYIYRSHIPATLTKTDTSVQSVPLPISLAFAHRYVDCLHVGKDGLHDWRNSIREDFMNHLRELRTELDMII